MAIADKLTELQTVKTAIHDAIEAKGQDLTNVPFTQYAEKITAIESGGGTVDTSGETAKLIFHKTVVNIEPSDVEGIGITKLRANLFDGFQNLETFISTKEQNVTLTGYNNHLAFANCPKLREVHLGVGGAGCNSVFYGCPELVKVKFFGQADFGNMYFAKCSNLKILDLRGCTKVSTLGNNVFLNATITGCKIIIPDGLYESWIGATNWVDLDTNAFTFVKASEYTE